MAVEVGSAYISIFPSFKGFATAVQAGLSGPELEGVARNAGGKIGQIVEMGATPMFGSMPIRLSKVFSDGLLSTKGMLMAAGAAIGVGALGIFAAATKSAGEFEAGMVKLTTTAGETGTMTSGNLRLVSEGVLKLAGDTATSQKQLSDGMYMVESAGFHGAAGLDVLKASAEGARAEQANLPTVTNAVTSALTSFHLKSTDATMITNEMIAAVGHGKMTFEDFAGSLSTVLPVASAAGISFAQVAGAEATLTNHGTSAQEATQELANTIRAMQNPSVVAQKEMQRLGIDSIDLASNLGKRGLTGSLDIVVGAITQHMGPAGTVLFNAFNNSRTAAADAKKMLDNMPASVRAVAQQFLEGKISINQYQSGIKGLPADQAAMARQFASLIDKTTGFNDLLKKGGPDAQTFSGALAKVMGGATGMNTALMLTGENMPAFQANVKAVGDAANLTGSHVEGWETVQHTFNFQLDAFKQKTDAAKTSLGIGFLPVAAQMLGVVTSIVGPIMSWVSGHAQLAGTIVTIVGGIGAFVAIVLALNKAVGALTTVMKILRIVTVEEDAALSANPIGLLILAIVALVAIFIYSFTHFKTFHNIVMAALHAVGAAAMWLWHSAIKPAFDAISAAAIWLWDKAIKPAFGFIMDHWKLLALVLFGPLIAVIGAFVLIGTTVMWLWDKAIRPAFTFIREHWLLLVAVLFAPITAIVAAFMLIGAIVMWLWNNAIVPAFQGIRAVVEAVFGAIVAVWNGVLYPVISFIAGVIKWLAEAVFWVYIGLIKAEWMLLVLAVQAIWNDVLHPVFQAIATVITWLWTNIAQPIWLGMQLAWQALMAGLKWEWDNVLSPVLNAIAAAGRWLWNDVLMPVWNAMKAAWADALLGMKIVWDNVLHPALTAIADAGNWLWGILKDVWDAMKTAWSDLLGGMKALWDNVLHPVFDTIGTVVRTLGADVGKAFDGIAHAFAAAWDDAKNAVVTGWNNIAGWVNANVIDKVNSLFHIHIPDLGLISTGGGNQGTRPISGAYAGGGPVFGPGTSTSDSIHAMLSDGEFVLRADAVKSIGVDKLNWLNQAGHLMFLGGDASGMTVQLPGFADGGNVDATKAFIRNQAGKPYVMDATGPGAWDCSGLVGAVYAMLKGLNPYARYFSTVNEGDFFKPGLSSDPHAFNVGYYGGGGASGHTVGVLDGLHFEATPPVALVGSTNYTPESSLFTGHGHLDVGTSTIWGWLVDHTVGEVKNWINDAISGVDSLIPNMGMFSDLMRSIIHNAASLLSFDDGGWLPDGGLARNTSGAPEPVFSHQQWRNMQAAAGNTDAARPIEIHVHPRQEQSESDIAAAVSRELAWAMR